MKNLPDLESLSYACISVQPIDYEFSGGNWAEATEGGGWRICEGSLLPEGMKTEVYNVHAGVNVAFDIVLDEDTFEIEVTRYTVDDNGASYDSESTYSPNDKEYDALVKHFGLDGNAVREAVEAGNADWEPMMNYAYPLDRHPPDDWKTKVNCCTVVEIDEKYYLALTGGGMDFSWEICESYMRLGYLPPAHFASSLPRMAGRGTSNLDEWILRGCYTTLTAIKERAEEAMLCLIEMNPSVRTRNFALEIRGYHTKIAAIKALRALIPSIGLKEAKDLVERAPEVISNYKGAMTFDEVTVEQHANFLRKHGVKVEIIEVNLTE